MMRIGEWIGIFADARATAWGVQMAVGVMLILTALALIVFPELLAALVAAVVLLVGGMLVGSAWRLRRIDKTMARVCVMRSRDW